jgi:lipid-binding SYLF domain-containing protein
MNPRLLMACGTLLALMCAFPAVANDDKAAKTEAKYADAKQIFLNADASAVFFNNSYGYALFPTIGKGGVGLGGAHGSGRVYVGGSYVGDTKMTQVTIGFQLGGQAFSQIIFFQDERAFNEFTGGNFEFGAQATAVAITAGASASASTTGNTAGASGGKNDAAVAGGYNKGYAIFTIAKGGLMYEASIGGQKFSYKPRQ